jgi:endonuclease YncB( thermonuclease family)
MQADAQETTYIQGVIDATTLMTAEGDTVRLIGIRPFASAGMDEKDLADYLEVIVGGVQVELTRDAAMDARGDGATWCYVTVGGTLVNQHVVEEGIAEAAADQRHARREQFVAAADIARQERVGRWEMEDQFARMESGTDAGAATLMESIQLPAATFDHGQFGLLAR